MINETLPALQKAKEMGKIRNIVSAEPQSEAIRAIMLEDSPHLMHGLLAHATTMRSAATL